MRARWQLFDVAHAPVVAEIEKQGDRAAAIVAAAFLEEQLAGVIKSSLADEPKIIKNIFKGHGPLASLSTKIDFGLLLGIYGRGAHRQLVTIKDVRNKFAHSVRPVTFNSQAVADLCNNLPAPKRRTPPRISDERDERLFETDSRAWLWMWLDWINSGKDTPRNRFLITVRLHYVRFALWQLIKDRTGQAPRSLVEQMPREAHHRRRSRD